LSTKLPRFSGDDQALVDALGLQRLVGPLRQGENVRRENSKLLTVIVENTFLELKSI
jgi:hypothetical protein